MLQKLTLGRWNVTSLMGKEQELVREVEKFRLDKVASLRHTARVPEPASSSKRQQKADVSRSAYNSSLTYFENVLAPIFGQLMLRLQEVLVLHHYVQRSLKNGNNHSNQGLSNVKILVR